MNVSTPSVGAQLPLLFLAIVCSAGFVSPSAVYAQPVAVDFRVTSDWQTGFVGEIELTNTGREPIEGWTLEFDLGGQLVNLWNGRLAGDAIHGHRVVGDLGWNGHLPPGTSAHFGFQVAYSGERPEPSHCLFNGRACTFTGDVAAPPRSPDPPAPVPPPTGSGATVEWEVLERWNTGYVAEIRIVNDASLEIADWTLQFELGGSIDGTWDVDLASAGTSRTATGIAGGTAIPAGGITTFGFVGSHQGAAPEPASCVLNGQACVFAGVSQPPPSPPAPPPAPTPLAVSIVSPLAGATVSDDVAIVAEVLGDAIARVDFLVDGALVGSDTASPYSHVWSTSALAGGDYRLTARVIGTAEKATSQPITVTVAPPPLPPPSGTDGFLSMSGSTMVDSEGRPVRLTGVNWFGFETATRAVHGLWSRDYRSLLHQVRDLGFNAVRIPWSNAILEPGSMPTGITFSGADPYDGRSPMNEPLQGKSSLEVLDLLVEAAGELGLKVILDNHSRKPDNFIAEELWYLPDFPERRWIEDWTTLAARYRGDPTVVAFDLHNEPHGRASWGGDPATDWAAAAERAAAAIHAVHPDVILIVGGVQTYQGVSHWWGSNLRGVRDRPLAIDPAKLLYSAHDYGPEVFPQTWFSAPDFPDNLIGLWDETWGYIPATGLGGVFIGEFGIKDRNAFAGRALQWIQTLMAYMGSSSSWTFWSLNPNSGDTGGILEDDWVGVHQWKMDLLAPYQARQFPPGAP